MDFTKKRWLELTLKVQMKTAVSSLTSRTKGFFSFIQRNFVFTVLVDCALASLMSAGKIVAADIFVYSRAIEDTVDMVLMRSRSEAELARLMTQISNLKELSDVWKTAKQRNLFPCRLESHVGGDSLKPLVAFRNVMYTRGTAVVQIHEMDLPAGIYALTGANGSGKSTLFRVIMSCDTNDRPIDIPPSISLSIPAEASEGDNGRCLERSGISYTDSTTGNSCFQPSVTMSSSNVVEISQTFYWPLYSKPIDWILQKSTAENLTEKERQEGVRRVAELLHSLEFTQNIGMKEVDKMESKTLAYPYEEPNNVVASSPTGDVITRIIEDLEEDKEDWFNDLSGGQRSKVELVRKVFLMDECPHILLIDETMAPLDPRSKSLVMAQIKSFCAGSVVIVIYHTDVGMEQTKEGGEVVECVSSSDFFDGNIHVEDKTMHLRAIC